MSERRRRATRVQERAFMDVARDAFVRHLALDRWRDLADLQEAAGFELTVAAAEAGRFVERGRYAPLWAARWAATVVPAVRAGADPGAIFAAIEQAIGAALAAEDAARHAGGDRPLDEDPAYRTFVDGALARLAREMAPDPGTG